MSVKKRYKAITRIPWRSVENKPFNLTVFSGQRNVKRVFKRESQLLNLGSFVKKLKKTFLIIGCHSGSCPRLVEDWSGIFLRYFAHNACIQKDSRRVRHTQGGLAGMTFQAGVITLHRKSRFQFNHERG
jgi:hypothetical protein